MSAAPDQRLRWLAAATANPIRRNGTGITAYLTNGGTLDAAQRMAGHSDPRTTKLYDRRGDQVSMDDVERISF